MNRPDPDEVAEATEYLRALPDPDYARVYAEVITCRPGDTYDVLRGSPEPVARDAALAAFRSMTLLQRSLDAVEGHIRRTNNLLNPRKRGYDPSKTPARARFRTRMGQERSMLGQHRQAYAVIGGRGSNAPNPRQRAMERLWQLNLKGDVPKGTGRQLLAEEEEKVRAARKKAREEWRGKHGTPPPAVTG